VALTSQNYQIPQDSVPAVRVLSDCTARCTPSAQTAERIGVPFQRGNAIANCRRRITPDTALRLARVFGTSPDFRLNLQQMWDLYHAMHSDAGKEIERLRSIAQPA
jgi:addiction module HigA family antidote